MTEERPEGGRDQDVLTVAEFARRTGLGLELVYRLVRKGDLPAHRFGDRILIRYSEVWGATRVPAPEPKREPARARRGSMLRRALLAAGQPPNGSGEC